MPHHAGMLAGRDPTAWLGREDSNLRVLHFDPLSIDLKCRRDFRGLCKSSAPETHSRTSCKSAGTAPSDLRSQARTAERDARFNRELRRFLHGVNLIAAASSAFSVWWRRAARTRRTRSIAR
jgi:hypothetical protein